MFWRVRLSDGPPDAGEWEEVVEGSFRPVAPPVELHSWGHDTVHRLDLPMQEYNFWFCGRGLDGDRHGAFLREERQPDEYELCLWADAIARPERIVKTTTRAAAYWHNSAANERYRPFLTVARTPATRRCSPP